MGIAVVAVVVVRGWCNVHYSRFHRGCRQHKSPVSEEEFWVAAVPVPVAMENDKETVADS